MHRRDVIGLETILITLRTNDCLAETNGEIKHQTSYTHKRTYYDSY